MKIVVELSTDQELNKFDKHGKEMLLKGDIDEIDAGIIALQKARKDREQRIKHDILGL